MMKQQTIKLDLIDSDPDQPRRDMDETSLKELAVSIRDQGLLQPPIVSRRGDRYLLADGHRRCRACRLIGRDTVDVWVLDQTPDAKTLLLTQLAVNCHRADLKPMEKALAFRRLQDAYGWSNAELARSLSVSKSKVTQVLSYHTLPPEAQSMLDSGALAGSTAYAISRAPDEATRQIMLKAAMNGQLKRDAANTQVNRRSSSVRTARATFRLAEAEIVIVAGEKPDLVSTVTLLQQVIRECRTAAKQGLNVTTFERVLKDRHCTES